MNCPRCSAELPDSAITCSRCGSPVRSASSSFSYLPAGSPPWPNTVPQSFSYTTGASGLPALQATQPTLQVGSSPVARSAVKPRKSPLGAPLIIALFLVSILVGGGATLGILYANGQFSANNNSQATGHVVLPAPNSTVAPSPTTGTANQLPTPTSFKTINNSDVGISVQYPSDWVTDPVQKTTDSSYFGIHPQQSNGLLLSIERFSVSTSAKITGTKDVNQNNLVQIQNTQGILNFQSVPAATPQRTIGGVAWDEADATFSNSQGTAFHITSIAAQRNHLFYDIFFFAPVVYYDQAIQEYFQPMFDSFKFLS